MIRKTHSRWIQHCMPGVIGLVMLFALPHHAHSGEIVSLNFDSSQVWAYFDQGWQAYDKGDWVEAHRLLAMAYPLYLQLRGNPLSPFPQDSQFSNDFTNALKHAHGELLFWTHQFPEQSRRAYAELGAELGRCRFQLSGSDRSYSFVLPEGQRPSKPGLRRVQPPQN